VFDHFVFKYVYNWIVLVLFWDNLYKTWEKRFCFCCCVDHDQ